MERRTEQNGESHTQRLADLKALIATPGSDPDTLNRAIFTGPNSTQLLKDIVAYALRLLTATLAKHKDLEQQPAFRAVVDEAKKPAENFVPIYLPVKDTEAQMRDRCKQLTMQVVRLRRRVEHVAQEVRGKVAKQTKKAGGRK